MRGDVLALLEGAYRLDVGLDAWVRGIAEIAGKLVDDDQLLFAYAYDLTSPTEPRFGPTWAVRATDGFPELLDRMISLVPPELIPEAYPQVPFVGWASRKFGRSRAGRKLLAEFPWKDAMGVCCPSGPTTGLIVTVCSPRSRCETTARATWVKIAIHLSSAARLRRALELGGRLSTLDVTDGADAVLDPSGTVLHAEGEARDARDALRSAAVALDRARGKLRKSDPERALSSWHGLVDARWTLVDHFERDGRRFVVARRNDPRLARPRALTRGERHVVALAAVGHPTKVIAYQLGLNVASATASLSRALTKLGVKSRVELAGIASVLHPWGPLPRAGAKGKKT